MAGLTSTLGDSGYDFFIILALLHARGTGSCVAHHSCVRPDVCRRTRAVGHRSSQRDPRVAARRRHRRRRATHGVRSRRTLSPAGAVRTRPDRTDDRRLLPAVHHPRPVGCRRARRGTADGAARRLFIVGRRRGGAATRIGTVGRGGHAGRGAAHPRLARQRVPHPPDAAWRVGRRRSGQPPVCPRRCAGSEPDGDGRRRDSRPISTVRPDERLQPRNDRPLRTGHGWLQREVQAIACRRCS